MLWKAGEAAWTGDAREIFAELELADGARRQLYESAAFRSVAGRDVGRAAARGLGRPHGVQRDTVSARDVSPARPCGLVQSDEEAGDADGLALAAAA